jgi:hypothetical protein
MRIAPPTLIARHPARPVRCMQNSACVESGQSSASARLERTSAGTRQPIGRGPGSLLRLLLFFICFQPLPASCSFRIFEPSPSNETDFNSCTLACREAPCGCVTAPPCSQRGGMGLGTSAAALPVFLRASIETCYINPQLQKQNGPEPCGVAGPFGLKRGA